jgi:hypothetical protein
MLKNFWNRGYRRHDNSKEDNNQQERRKERQHDRSKMTLLDVGF